jgi:hypothetical protein
MQELSNLMKNGFRSKVLVRVSFREKERMAVE